MPHSNILDRFRPVGAPGPVGPAGVPAADEHGPSAELVPVFTALAPDIESARKLIEQAEKDATDIIGRARDEASALLAQAQLDGRSARAGATARVTKVTTDRDEALLADARNQAEVLARTGTGLLSEMTHTVVDRMLAELRQQ
jgi:vacuolar-type H+-ATPase subunit H